VSLGLLALVAAATGAAVLVVELMAVRLMAPWFGQSQPVWTSVIGVVLAALAAGQWLGGRWAESRRGAGPAALLLAAGALSLALPELVGLLAAAVRPADLQLEEAWPFVTWGSLLTGLLTLGLPMAALGAVTPWLVRLAPGAAGQPGRVAGAILGAGTAGSLVGAFGSTFLLLPALGSAGAVRLAGGVLLLTAVPLLRGGRARASLAWLLLPAGLSLLPEPAARPELLEERETCYQVARVELAEDGARVLRLNEGLDSFHSAFVEGSPWTGRYFDAFALPALAAPAGPDGERRVLVLGLGAGSMARLALALDPSLQVHGVEIDAALVDLGRRWFELPAAVHVHVGDARVALGAGPPGWGAVLLDCYSSQIYLPPHLCTLEFFRELRLRLAPGGVAALNLGGRTREDPVVAAVAGTFGAVFPGATMARVPGSRNWIVLGWNGPAPSDARLAERLAAAGAGERLRWMVDGGSFAPVPVASRPLTDADAPVEALAHRSWRAGA
jgi:spermidine synthase